MKILIAFISLISVASANTIVCKKKTADGEMQKVTITDSKVTVSLPSFSQPRVFTKLKRANGLITDYGLAIKYSNDYGCIRKVLVITDVKEPIDAGYMHALEFLTCSGGSTPDHACGVNSKSAIRR